jgi:hypothetical protein
MPERAATSEKQVWPKMMNPRRALRSQLVTALVAASPAAGTVAG